ncbi:MFS family permease [Paraburkholderia sp. HC6.4b]|uniref:MFS transporter n=1 Tax=unclassified Paraburkholderia TaxID=2615204 RepID=UPI00161A65A3|nr:MULTISPECIES: MFS transporter [unclassified Paraburkholderia]MBB5406298.1 MFS family permease [Paraburkholderia sp. HC6.4b]MBB5448695.1 MFS family permease [Paraburkholderia sp. Kb1A]
MMTPAQASLEITPPSTRTRSQRRMATWSAYLGTLIEYYDFFLYSLLAVVAFAPLFFPNVGPLTGLLASFATLATGYVARPLGAVAMSAIGDRIGRRVALLISVAGMGIASILIGLLPPYAAIGVWAPTLLVILRFLQGLAAGGEYGGGVLMALEHANSNRRGIAAAAPQMGLYSGIILANVALLLATLLPNDAFLAWGWRVPFLLTAVLMVITIWLRSKVDETPVFEQAKREHRLADRPVMGLFRTQWRTLLTVVAVAIVVTTISALNLSIVPMYSIRMGFSRSEALSLTLIGVCTGLVLVPTFAWLSDYVGRKRVALIGVILIPFSAWGAFSALGAHSYSWAVAGAVMPVIAHSVAYGPVSTWMAELFPTRFRYGGISVGFQIASLGAGVFPLIATALLTVAGGPPHFGWIVVYIALIAGISLIAISLARETSTATFEELDSEVTGPQILAARSGPGTPRRNI